MTGEEWIRELVRDVVREEIATHVLAAAAPTNLTIPEARRALGGVARSTVFDMIRRGDLRAIRVNRRRTVIDPASVTQYLARRAR